MATRRTIVLRGEWWEDAGPAGAEITPGMLLEPDPSDPRGFLPHSTAGGPAAPVFAREGSEMDGAGIDTPIPSGGEVKAAWVNLGAKINAVTSETISRGEFVESAGDGEVRPHAPGSGYAIGIALSDSDLSGDIGRVEIAVAPNGI